jgi:hypothetical protein
MMLCSPVTGPAEVDRLLEVFSACLGELLA